MSFYEILEVSSTATPLEIKRAYRRLVLIHHPDKGGNPDRFKRIQTAYEVLKDDKRRRAYDRNGEREEEKGEDLFQNLFGQSGIFNLFNRLRKPPPAIYRKEVTLEELCRRLTLSLKVTRDRVCKCQKTPELYRECRECRECRNGIVDDTKIFSIHLTPLTYNGYRYKFVGEGNEQNGGEIGDFIVEIRHSPHPMFTLKDGHLIFHRKTTLHESLCGYTSIVLHPSGENIVLSFKGVIKPEEQRTIKGKGMIDEHDLIVVHTIIFPNTLTEEQTRRIDSVFKLKE